MPRLFCRKEVAAEARYAGRVSFFLFRELVYNVSRHSLVPAHRKLTEAEAAMVFAHYSVTPTQLPLLLMQDPVCRYYDFAPGSIIAITRAGAHEGAPYFRRVEAVAA